MKTVELIEVKKIYKYKFNVNSKEEENVMEFKRIQLNSRTGVHMNSVVHS